MRDGSLQAERHTMKERRLFRLLAGNLAIGSFVAVGTVAGLIATDAQGLRGLLMNDSDPMVAILLLTFGFVITFGSAAMGAAIMALSRPEASGGGGGRKALPARLRPALAPVRRSRGRAGT